jgi:hypothetical protein
MSNIEIDDIETIRSLKELEKKEKDLIESVINHDSVSTEEILSCLSSVNLVLISSEYHRESNATIGYRLAVNTGDTLGKLYEVLLSVRHSLIKESDKVSMTHQLDDISQELKKTTLLIEDIMQEISKLLTCEKFLHTIDISYGNEESEIFVKKLHLKRHSSHIPNPHDIPSAYRSIVGTNQKEIYRIYSNFVHYFTCNWVIGIKSLGKIKKSFNELHNLCPLVRLSIMKEILRNNEMSNVPSDIIKSIASIDPKSLIHFHSSYLATLINNSKSKDATTDLLLVELKKIAQKLTEPMTDVIHFNIVMESTVKTMMIMRELQGQKSLNSGQRNTLNNIETFFSEITKKVSVTVKEMLSVSYAISAPLIEEVKKQQKTTTSPSQGMSF